MGRPYGGWAKAISIVATLRRAALAIATAGAPHDGAQAGTIGYFFLCKFSITV